MFHVETFYLIWYSILLANIWIKVFKNRPSKICGIQLLSRPYHLSHINFLKAVFKKFTPSILEYLDPYVSLLFHLLFCFRSFDYDRYIAPDINKIVQVLREGKVRICFVKLSILRLSKISKHIPSSWNSVTEAKFTKVKNLLQFFKISPW